MIPCLLRGNGLPETTELCRTSLPCPANSGVEVTKGIEGNIHFLNKKIIINDF